MTRSDLVDLLNELEASFPVNSWTVNDASIWPLIRVKLGFSPFVDFRKNGRSDERAPQKRRVRRPVPMIRRTAKSVRRAVDIFRTERQLGRRADVVMLSASHFRTKMGATWYHRFIDPVIEAALAQGLRPLLQELHFGVRDRSPVENAACVVPVERYLKAKSTRRSTKAETSLPDYSRFTTLLHEKDPSVPLDFLDEKILVDEALHILKVQEVFERVLRKLQARTALLTAYYDPYGMAFCRAARQVGIPCVDIQHGVLDRSHFAYGRWTAVPTSGYDMLPSDFWVWTAAEESVIEEWSNGTPHRPVVTGNLWMNHWKSEHGSASTVESIVPDGKMGVLLTLQPLPSMSEFVPETVFRAINEGPDNWFWMVRLHPNQTHRRDEVKRVFARRCRSGEVEVNRATDLPLPALLEQASVHVTWNSTVVLEAEQFGVRSVVLDAGAGDMYRSQIEQEIAVQADDDLVSAIRRQINARTQSTVRESAADIGEILQSVA